MKKALVWLRRDFRLTDNPALFTAARDFSEIIPVFVFDPKIISEFQPGSKPALAFFGALIALEEELKKNGRKIVFLKGNAQEKIPEFIFKNKIDAVFFNRDYEPWGRLRDENITQKLKTARIEVNHFKDHVLFEPHEVLNQSGDPYKVFTPYKNNCLTRMNIKPPTIYKKIKLDSVCTVNKNFECEDKKVIQEILELIENGKAELNPPFPIFGEQAALKRLKFFIEDSLKRYSESRNALSDFSGTSRLSIDLRTGAISPRQIWISIQASSASSTERSIFLSELLWRNFFMSVGMHFTHVFETNFNPKYNKIKWKNKKSDFAAWCEGRTGYPVVDAGMRELVKTGFMHNRARMITAMFLTKDLLIDWRWGEQFFRQHLMDGDRAVNNGNWQWAASTGCDAQPYFRIFNPITQAKKFDPKGIYIQKWVKELNGLDIKTIHEPWKNLLFVKGNYPPPMVDHSIARKECLSAYDTSG